MKLVEILYQKTNDQLKELARLCNYSGPIRKDNLAQHIRQAVTTPASLHGLWRNLDDLSKKVVAAAYHNDGEFNPTAFAAQYGKLPERPKKGGLWYTYQPILLDLFIYDQKIPSDLMPLLEKLVPPPDKFQLAGLPETPQTTLDVEGEPIPLICIETEQVGLHDLVAYLRLVDTGQIKIGASSSRATLGSIKKIADSLLQADFFPLPEKYRANQTIRPFGLDVFAQESGLVTIYRGELRLTETGQAFYQSQSVDLLLEAFETWSQEGSFDELSRISVIKGQTARSTSLTKPATRREAIIEALSWCPVGVWIDIEDFYQAIKIWHFDFEVETTSYTNLYIGDQQYGMLYGEAYWPLVKGLYINVVLWEYLGSIGALDLLYIPPEEANFHPEVDHYYWDDDYFSLYDGLKYFRINRLGAYLLGQAGQYLPSKPLDHTLFTISTGMQVTLLEPDELTPNDQHLLEQMAIPVSGASGRYQLDTRRLLDTLEKGGDLTHLTDFLQRHHAGPLPPEVSAWLEKIEQNSEAFKIDGQALLIKANSVELAALALNDPILQKFCYLIDPRTLAIPANKQNAFRTRLKELEYILSS